MGGGVREGQDELSGGGKGSVGSGDLRDGETRYPHRPVLLQECIRFLLTRPDGVYVDGTVGTGGHSETIARSLGPGGRLISLDRDADAVRIARERLSTFGGRVTVLRGNFSDLKEIVADQVPEGEVDGVLLDLGISTLQIEHSGRGFSFIRDEPLDMRMDQEEGLTAQKLITRLSARDLEEILRRYGEERKAKRIAYLLKKGLGSGAVRSSLDLAHLVEKVVPHSHRPGAKNPATRTFQAIRIAVNRELENLEKFLDEVPSWIRKGGRVVILSYHSLEDRMAKQAMVRWEGGCTCPPRIPQCVCGKKPLFRRLQKKGLKPTEAEIQGNPRSRSATLRAAERV